MKGKMNWSRKLNYQENAAGEKEARQYPYC